MDFQPVLAVPDRILGAPGLCADIVLAEDASGGQQQRISWSGALVGRDVFGDDELALAADETVDMHHRRALGRLLVAGPLHGAEIVKLGVGDAGKGRRQRGDLVHDLRRMIVVDLKTDGLGEADGDFPVGQPVARGHHFADALDAALGVGEGAVLLQEGRSGQEDVGVVRRLVEEEVVHDDALHRRQRRDHMPGVGIGLQDVLALHIEAHEGALDRGVEHVRDAQARLRIELDVPQGFKLIAHRLARDVPVARQFVRERAHVAGALNVILAAQRVHADAGPADIAGRHRKVGDRDDGGRSPGCAR